MICLFVLSLGWVLVSIPLVAEFLFSGESKCRTHFVCGVWKLMKQGEAFSALLVVRGFAGQQVCLCFDGLFCFCGMLLGV